MIKRFKLWLRRQIFNLLKDDIKGLIIQEVCHLDPPTTTKVGWQIVAPQLLDRIKAQDVSWNTHRGIANYLEVKYKVGAKVVKKSCVPLPPEGVDIREYLLGRPEALL